MVTRWLQCHERHEDEGMYNLSKQKQSVSVSVQFQVLEILEENQRYHIFIVLETISISIKIKHLGCVKPIPSQNLLYLRMRERRLTSMVQLFFFQSFSGPICGRSDRLMRSQFVIKEWN